MTRLAHVHPFDNAPGQQPAPRQRTGEDTVTEQDDAAKSDATNPDTAGAGAPDEPGDPSVGRAQATAMDAAPRAARHAATSVAVPGDSAAAVSTGEAPVIPVNGPVAPLPASDPDTDADADAVTDTDVDAEADVSVDADTCADADLAAVTDDDLDGDLRDDSPEPAAEATASVVSDGREAEDELADDTGMAAELADDTGTAVGSAGVGTVDELAADIDPVDGPARDVEASAAPSPGPRTAGATTVADEVVEKVVNIAVRRVSGVYDLGGDASRLLEATGERADVPVEGGRAIVVRLRERTATVAVTLVVEYGHPVYGVADRVRDAVADVVEEMLGIEVAEVDIVVDDVHMPDE